MLLVLGFIDLLTRPGYNAADMVILFVRELGVGLLVGMLVGAVAGWICCGARDLRTAGLYPVASLTAAALAYGGADTLHGSGFLAVYLAGLVLGSAVIPGGADDRDLSRGAGLGGPGRAVPRRWGCWSSPRSCRRWH